MEPLRPGREQTESFINSEAFSEEWLQHLRRLIETRLVGSRLPNDFSLDLFQEQILAAIVASRDTDPADWHGRAIRISLEAINRAIADERRFYRHFPVRLDDVRWPAYRLDWLQFKFGQPSPSSGETPASRGPDILAILRRRLTGREFKFLELHYLAIAPGKTRPYTIREIATLWGYSYGYLRHFARRTVDKVRRLVTEANDRARTEP